MLNFQNVFTVHWFKRDLSTCRSAIQNQGLSALTSQTYSSSSPQDRTESDLDGLISVFFWALYKSITQFGVTGKLSPGTVFCLWKRLFLFLKQPSNISRILNNTLHTHIYLNLQHLCQSWLPSSQLFLRAHGTVWVFQLQGAGRRDETYTVKDIRI